MRRAAQGLRAENRRPAPALLPGGAHFVVKGNHRQLNYSAKKGHCKETTPGVG